MRTTSSMQGVSLSAVFLSVVTGACSDSGSQIRTSKSDPIADSGVPTESGGSGGAQSVTGGKSSTGGAPFATGGSSNETGGLSLETGGAFGGRSGTGGLGVTGGSAGAAGATGTGGAAGAPKSFPCNNPSPMGGGFVMCEGNWLHRAAKESCPPRQPRPNPTCQFGMTGNCTKDSDCTAKPDGYCPGGVNVPCSCVYPCHGDEECQSGEICECQSGDCVPATCTTDADCEGRLCSEYSRAGSVCGRAFACQSLLDECASWNDCANQAPCSMTDGHRTCGPFCYSLP